MKSIFFLRCGLKNPQSPASRFVHNWIVEESFRNKTGEFSQDCKKYQVLLARMTSGNLSGPASVLFGKENSIVDWHDRGIVALRSSYGMRVYPEDANSNSFNEDPFQPYLTAASLCGLYHKCLSLGHELPGGSGGIFNHNETRIKADDDSLLDVVPLVTNVAKINDARNWVRSSDLLKNAGEDVCYYDEKTGILYSSDVEFSGDQRSGLSKIELPNTVLSLKNMKSNPDMFEFVKRNYEHDVELYTRFMVELILSNKIKEGEIEALKKKFINEPFLNDLGKELRESGEVVSNFGLGSKLLGVFIDDVKNQMKKTPDSRISDVEFSKLFGSRQNSSSGNSR